MMTPAAEVERVGRTDPNAGEILVLGAGIVGVMIAFRLQEEGARVTLVDARPEVAAETSHANGGQLSFASAGTWSGTELISFLWRGLVHTEVRPWDLLWRSLPTALLWSLGAHPRGAERLHALVRLSAQEFDRLLEDSALASLVEARGVWALRRHARGSVPADLPSPVRLERGRAVFHAGDLYGDCRRFAQTLADRFRARGGRILLGVRVRALVCEPSTVRVETTRGVLAAERVVVASGLAARVLLGPLGVRLPLFPVQGYSLTYPCSVSTPRFALLDEDHKVVLTRLGDGLRVAGLLDFGRRDGEPRPRMIARLEKIARLWVPDLTSGSDPAAPWACVRAMAPGGVPFLGSVARGRVVVSVGHGHLGWTLSAASARYVSDLLAGRPPPLPPEDYAPAGRD